MCVYCSSYDTPTYALACTRIRRVMNGFALWRTPDKEALASPFSALFSNITSTMDHDTILPTRSFSSVHIHFAFFLFHTLIVPGGADRKPLRNRERERESERERVRGGEGEGRFAARIRAAPGPLLKSRNC